MGQSCPDSFYIKKLYAAGVQVITHDQVMLQDNSIILCGQISPSTGVNGDALLVRLDVNGNIVWERVFESDGAQYFQKIIRCADGGVLTAGYQEHMGLTGLVLCRFDLDGRLQWRKDYSFKLGASLGIADIKEDAEGAFLLLANFMANGLSFSDKIFFARFDQQGALKFSQAFYQPVTLRSMQANQMVLHNGTAYIAGYCHDWYKHQGMLLRVNARTAALQWSKFYSFNNGEASFKHVLKPGSNQLYLLGTNNVLSGDTTIVLVTDLDGQVVSSKCLSQQGWRDRGAAALDGAGNILYGDRFYLTSAPANTGINVVKFHPQLGGAWSKVYPQIGGIALVFGLGVRSNNEVVLSGTSYEGNKPGSSFISRLPISGELNCSTTDLFFKFGEARSRSVIVTFTAEPAPITDTVISYNLSGNLPLSLEQLCTRVSDCSSFSLGVSRNICSAGDTLVLSIRKNAGCIAAPAFTYDQSMFRWVGQTESEVRFIAIKQGSSKVAAAIEGLCGTIKDSITLSISFSAASFSLGSDTALCSGQSLQLRAGDGFASYQWQDGSIGSTYDVKKPGIYHVRTINSCGGVFSDTIRVTEGLAGNFDIGADRTLCDGDTIMLQMPPGFNSYVWRTSDGTLLGSDSSILIHPDSSDTYTAMATHLSGCTVTDIISIKVKAPMFLDLGNDTSLCTGDSLVLQVGSDFNQLLWWDGSSTASRSVTAKGAYSVKAWDSNGCVSTDTIKVLNLFPVPQVRLGFDTVLCSGQARVLEAGSGFSNYFWSTGATTSSIAVQDTGMYRVMVVDRNGCYGDGQVRINKRVAAPANFLPAQLSLCQYGSIKLKPLNTYAQYLWSTNAVTSEIDIFKPGTYWLEALDLYGCRGRDSILIKQKQCLEGFYIPNAFSPNGDRLNEVFKPLIFEPVANYHFLVFNRWGDVVYESRILEQGWNGKVKGVADNTAIFTWLCTYRNADQVPQVKRGTVALIK
ncbi:hypothetical protein BUE76_05460 [Cnuella takakiae]|nr:hypothetical protein BUE76_05460 [Cnuella takakiae]